jgi:hypothetical protein
MNHTIVYSSKDYKAVSHANGLGVELFDNQTGRSCYLQGAEARAFLVILQAKALARVIQLFEAYKSSMTYWPVLAC